MRGTENLAVTAWLYSTLSSDSNLASLVSGVYDTVAPPDAQLPFVVVSEAVPPVVVSTLPAAHVMVSGIWQVRVTVEGLSWQPAATAVERIHTLLQGANTVTGDGAILGCVREGLVKYAEQANGRNYRHLGGLYRINAL